MGMEDGAKLQGSRDAAHMPLVKTLGLVLLEWPWMTNQIASVQNFFFQRVAQHGKKISMPILHQSISKELN